MLLQNNGLSEITFSLAPNGAVLVDPVFRDGTERGNHYLNIINNIENGHVHTVDEPVIRWE